MHNDGFVLTGKVLCKYKTFQNSTTGRSSLLLFLWLYLHCMAFWSSNPINIHHLWKFMAIYRDFMVIYGDFMVIQWDISISSASRGPGFSKSQLPIQVLVVSHGQPFLMGPSHSKKMLGKEGFLGSIKRHTCIVSYFILIIHQKLQFIYIYKSYTIYCTIYYTLYYISCPSIVIMSHDPTAPPRDLPLRCMATGGSVNGGSLNGGSLNGGSMVHKQQPETLASIAPQLRNSSFQLAAIIICTQIKTHLPPWWTKNNRT